jgi:unsaturated rhamnogalacturonyl hydrolase
MWYQVMDCPTRKGNYQESTGSIMLTYAMLKGARKGYLPEEFTAKGAQLYEKFVERFMRENEDGTISMTDCCAVGGLGGKKNRMGDFDYYLSEPIIENDCKGVGPFIWASMEYEMLQNTSLEPLP